MRGTLAVWIAGAVALASCGGGSSATTSNRRIDVDTKTLTKKQVCGLLAKQDAEALLGGPLAEEPSGMRMDGLGTNCIYRRELTGQTIAASSFAPYTEIKVEFNVFGFDATKQLLGSTASDLKSVQVDGFDGLVNAEKSGATERVVTALNIRISSNGQDPALTIEAPDEATATTAARKVLTALQAMSGHP